MDCVLTRTAAGMAHEGPIYSLCVEMAARMSAGSQVTRLNPQGSGFPVPTEFWICGANMERFGFNQRTRCTTKVQQFDQTIPVILTQQFFFPCLLICPSHWVSQWHHQNSYFTIDLTLESIYGNLNIAGNDSLTWAEVFSLVSISGNAELRCYWWFCYWQRFLSHIRDPLQKKSVGCFFRFPTISKK